VIKIAKKKKGSPIKVRVKASKPHRRKATWIKGHWRKRSSPHRNKAHTRNTRRTKSEIAVKKTRKEQKRRNIKKYHYNTPKKTQQAKLA